MKEYIAIDIPSDPKYLSLMRTITLTVGRIYGLPNKDIENIKLAIDEACTNVIKHAYRGDTSKRISVKYLFQKDFFKVLIEDNGLKSNIGLLKGRDLEDIKPGGLGIHFIKRAFDKFIFDKRKKKGNRLVLTKYLNRKK